MDKQASQQLLAERERAVSRGEIGLNDPYAAHRGTPLGEHLDAFCATIEAGGATGGWVQKIPARLRRAFQGMRATLPVDLTADAADRLLVSLKDEGVSVTTRNHYIAALRQFSGWGCERERWPTDPLRKLKKIRGDHDIRRKRRAAGPLAGHPDFHHMFHQNSGTGWHRVSCRSAPRRATSPHRWPQIAEWVKNMALEGREWHQMAPRGRRWGRGEGGGRVAAPEHDP